MDCFGSIGQAFGTMKFRFTSIHSSGHSKDLSRRLLMMVSLAAVLLFSTTAAALQIEDDQGKIIRLEQPAGRVISLYGAFAEMLYAIGAGDRLIARTEADHFPDAIRELPSIGTHMRPNVEMIIGIKPDLIIQSVSRQEAMAEMDSLARAGIPVAVFAPRNFSDIFSVMLRLGILTGSEATAELRVAGLKERLRTVRERLGVDGRGQTGCEMERQRPTECAAKKPLRVFFEVRAEPLTAAGQGSVTQDILSSAGAQNVVESERALLLYGFESLLFADPDVYIVQTGPMNKNPADPQKRPHFDQLRAVREGRVLFVDEFLYSRPGPRCVDAVEQLAAKLYPECFRQGP